tara:strand:+ start:98 stop:394 length:297 start_codon:yes stop_codon:yes gene_type:complete
MTTLTYKSNTFIWQGQQEFRCAWDFTGLISEATAIAQISEILEANAAGEEVFEDDNGEDFDLHGMTPKQFATFIVQEEEAAREMYGTSWEIHRHKVCE